MLGKPPDSSTISAAVFVQEVEAALVCPPIPEISALTIDQDDLTMYREDTSNSISSPTSESMPGKVNLQSWNSYQKPAMIFNQNHHVEISDFISQI